MNPVLSSGSRNFTVISLVFFVDVGPVISVEVLLTCTGIQAPTDRGACSLCDLKWAFYYKRKLLYKQQQHQRKNLDYADFNRHF